jgi:hypothetical protein
MTRLGIAVGESYLSAVITEGTRVRSFATQRRGEKAFEIDELFRNNGLKLKQHVNKLSSIILVTDVVRESISRAKDLDPIALFRLSLPEGADSPTVLDQEISTKILRHFFVVKGGHGFDGRTIGKPDMAEIRERYPSVHTENVVVSSPFSVLFPDQEEMVRGELARLGAKHIWLSNEVSAMPNILERETTAALSAATSHLIEQAERDVRKAISQFGRKSPSVYLGRNDGTVIGSNLAKIFTLETAWSVEGHSIAGASKLEQSRNCVVIGYGNGRMWIGCASNGLPLMRETAYIRDMFVHTNIPMLAEIPTDLVRAKEYIEILGDIVGSKRVFITGTKDTDEHPPTAKETKNSLIYAAWNAAVAPVKWQCTMNAPSQSKISSIKPQLLKRLRRQMVLAGSRGTKYHRMCIRPGYNLPADSRSVMISATGMPR